MACTEGESLYFKLRPQAKPVPDYISTFMIRRAVILFWHTGVEGCYQRVFTTPSDWSCTSAQPVLYGMRQYLASKSQHCKGIQTLVGLLGSAVTSVRRTFPQVKNVWNAPVQPFSANIEWNSNFFELGAKHQYPSPESKNNFSFVSVLGSFKSLIESVVWKMSSNRPRRIICPRYSSFCQEKLQFF